MIMNTLKISASLVILRLTSLLYKRHDQGVDCKQALHMDYSEIYFQIATWQVRESRACYGPCTI